VQSRLSGLWRFAVVYLIATYFLGILGFGLNDVGHGPIAPLAVWFILTAPTSISVLLAPDVAGDPLLPALMIATPARGREFTREEDLDISTTGIPRRCRSAR